MKFVRSWANLFAAVADSYSPQQWLKFRDKSLQRRVSCFKDISCFVLKCMVSGLNYLLLLWGLFLLLCFPLLLSGESATAAPQPNSEYRFCLSGFYESSPLPRPFISNLVPFPFYSLYQILLLSCTWLNGSYFFLWLHFEVIINIFPFKMQTVHPPNTQHKKCLLA